MLNTQHCFAKINLGLFVKGKRPDGYHDIETVFLPVHRLHDTLRVDRISQAYPAVFQYDGLPIPGSRDQNLVKRAYELMRSRYPKVNSVRILLEKHIPTGSGLGGGSSDAAGTIQALNRLFALGLSTTEMAALGAELGSDVPFFFYDQPMYATGRGDVLSPVEIPLPKSVRVQIPDVHIATADAYAMLDLSKCHTTTSLRDVLALPVSQWSSKLINDFQAPMVARYPEIGKAIAEMYEDGADYAAMTGSGSAVYGLYF